MDTFIRCLEMRYGIVFFHNTRFFKLSTISHHTFALYSELTTRLCGSIKHYFLTSLAACAGYSRIYLGMHYPSDVLAGGIVGCVIGYGMYRFYRSTYAVAERFAPRGVLCQIVLLLTMIWHRQTGTNIWLRSGYRD